MSTRARKRRTPDVGRMARALSHSGIDPRSWVAAGRVEDDPEAFRWDPELGWIADVSLYGGGLDDVTELPARTLGQGRGDKQGEFVPPGQGCEVLLAIPGGDISENPVVVGGLTNASTCLAPTEVNDLPINGDLQSSTPQAVSPYDTEIKRSPHNRREHYDGDIHTQAQRQVIEAAQQVLLATREAKQSFLRGEEFTSKLGDYLTAMATYIEKAAIANLKVYTAINSLAPGTITPDEILAVGNAAIEVPIKRAAYETAVSSPGVILSEKIKGD